MAIKKNGLKAKTNFKYNYIDIIKISKLNIDIKIIKELASKNDI